MFTYKCRICGGTLELIEGSNTAVCEYCGTEQTVPKRLDENLQKLYDLANNAFQSNDFSNAENLYRQILLVAPEDSNAYWSLVLCKYGVTYVKNPVNSEYVPTCNRTSMSSIFEDENYKKAIQFADEGKKAIYEKDAKTIDDIQRGIIELCKKEKPFDVFICYKESDENGNRTADSLFAQKVYNELTELGYKVFYSRITLESKIGSEYEPYIYSALSTSKVMLLIASNEEYVNAPWVKNEWIRYSSMSKADKNLIPLRIGMTHDKLPMELSALTSYDTDDEGFWDEFIRGIKKIIPVSVTKKEKRRKRRIALSIIAVILVISIIVGTIVYIPIMKKNKAYEDALYTMNSGNYALAIEKFDNLEGYKYSSDKSYESLVRWRKSLADTVCSVQDGNQAEYRYCINANGNIEDCGDIKKGKSLEIDESHGRPVSITGGLNPVILQEDGFVWTEYQNPKFDGKFEDVIQISNAFQATVACLMKDGTVKLYSFADDMAEYADCGYGFYDVNDSWLESVEEWTDIIEIKSFSDYWKGALKHAGIVGLKSDGTLVGVYYSEWQDSYTGEYYNESSSIEGLEQFSNVKDFDIGYSEELNENDESVWYYNVIATTDDNLCILKQNKFEKKNIKNVKDVSIWGDEMFYVNEKGELYRNFGSKSILSDVRYICNNLFATHTNSLYIGEYNYSDIDDNSVFEVRSLNSKVINYEG